MKIFLIQTPWARYSARDFSAVSKKFALYPPMGLLSLVAYVEKHGHQADIIDLEVDFLNVEALAEKIKNSGADIIGLTSTTPIFHIAKKYAKRLKELTGLPIVLGGVHITVLREKAFSEEFDFAVLNEGESTLTELLDALTGSKDYSSIRGLIYRDNGKTIVNPPHAFIENLDALPFASRERANPENYRFEVPEKGEIPVATIWLSRGCPFSCVFCSEPGNSGKKLRSRSVTKVLEEMIYVRDRFNISHFFFLDSTLTVNRKLVEDLCSEIIARGLKFTFEGQTRVNLVDDQLLALMKKAGLVRLSFGLESSDPEVLRLMKKQISPESFKTAISLCKKLKISALCGTMMGNPGDTKKTILATARFVRSIPEVRFATLSIAIPYPGTELYSMAQNKQHGLELIHDDYRLYSRYAGGVMRIDGMGPDELIKLQRLALFIMHSTPKKIIGIIQHFGLINMVKLGFSLIKSEISSRLFGREPVLAKMDADDELV